MMDLQIGLSLIIPIGVALVLFALEASRLTGPALQSWRGVVAPYFVAVSTLFGLFGAILVSDVWQGANNAKRAVQMESSSIRDIHLMARAAGIEAALLPRLRAYVKAASTEQPASTAIAVQRGETGKAYEALLREIASQTQLDTQMRTALLAGARDLLRAHEDRLHYASDFTAPIKWVAILVFGAITQIALMLVHVESRVPMRIAVGLFTVAFIFCLAIIAIFDAPFEFVLADEPAASLRLALPNP
jgi:hypothetical protein